MSKRVTFRLVVAGLVASVVVAALFVRRAPVASAAVITLVSAVFGLRFFLQRRSEAVIRAADRGDVAALESLAAGGFYTRYEGLVAIAVFESADAVLARPHRACFCDDDCGSALNEDIEGVLNAVSSMQAGDPKRALAGLRARVTSTSASETLALTRKAIVRDMLTCCVMVETDRIEDRAGVDALLEDAPLGARFLRGPLHLAAVGWRMRRGDLAGARALLDALRPWTPGSRLARKRGDLARELAALGGGQLGRGSRE